jgi:hypothetical protein
VLSYSPAAVRELLAYSCRGLPCSEPLLLVSLVLGSFSAAVSGVVHLV